MYVLQCAGGYPIPLTSGGDAYEVRKEIMGVCATATSTAAASQLTLIDDYGKVKTDENIDVTLVDLKGVANVDGNISVMFPEPVKTRKGIAVSAATNLVQGSILVYCR